MTDSKNAIPKDLVIEIHRMMCPGACPDYSLFVYSDGRILYEGRRYVAAKGTLEGRISAGEVRKILAEVYRMNFFSLEDRYDPIASDGATTTTSILVDGKTKQVINCHPSRAPDGLYLLEKMIDEISYSEHWVRDRQGQPVLKP
jgi:hypothetical protein